MNGKQLLDYPVQYGGRFFNDARAVEANQGQRQILQQLMQLGSHGDYRGGRQLQFTHCRFQVLEQGAIEIAAEAALAADYQKHGRAVRHFRENLGMEAQQLTCHVLHAFHH